MAAGNKAGNKFFNLPPEMGFLSLAPELLEPSIQV